MTKSESNVRARTGRRERSDRIRSEPEHRADEEALENARRAGKASSERAFKKVQKMLDKS